MTKLPDIFAALAAPFAGREIKSRTLVGKQLIYVTARTVMNRLDDVLGPENWWDDYTPSEKSVTCRLTIRLPDGSTLTKCDAGGYAGMADSGDDDKSGYSDAFKRAAVKFGVARYLYRDGVPGYCSRSREPGEDPAEPGHATPARAANGHAKRRDVWGPSKPATGPAAPPPTGSAPTTGRQLFAWAKARAKRDPVFADLVLWLNFLGRREHFPPRMVDWRPDQVARAYAEACRNLESMEGRS